MGEGALGVGTVCELFGGTRLSQLELLPSGGGRSVLNMSIAV